MTPYDFDQMRRAMVASQLRTNMVDDPRVIAAMGEVPRERYVPADRAPVAYVDRPVPLGGDRWMNTPLATGRLLTEAEAAPGDRALVVGAATGYVPAVLARLVRSVVALEEDEALVPMVTPKVTAVQGPLVAGWAEAAPYDLIIIDGAVEHVPRTLIDQLADGGRLGAAIVERGMTRLAIGRRAGSGFGMVPFADYEVVVLPMFAELREFRF